jgi:hypothetical protein
MRKETYKNILEQFSKKIKAASERRESCAVLMVPPMVMGFPMYPFDEALVFIRRQLVLSGYSVRQGLEIGQFIVTWHEARLKVKAKAPAVVESDTADDFFSSLANLQKTAQQIRANGSRSARS